MALEWSLSWKFLEPTASIYSAMTWMWWQVCCWRREYSRGREDMPGAVEDCQGVYDERRRNSGQEKKQQQKLPEVGRPVRSTDVHEVHRCSQVRPVDRPSRPEWVCRIYRALCLGPVDRTGRPMRDSENQQSSLFVFGRPDPGSVDRQDESR